MSTSISRIRINAPAERVWDAITKPELVKQWQYGSDLVTDWQVGSGIRFRSVWGDQVYEQWGTVLTFSPCQSLSYTLFAPRPGLEDKPENYFTMRYTLNEERAGTLLSIERIDNRPGSGDNIEETTETGEDEQSVLTQLRRLTESAE